MECIHDAHDAGMSQGASQSLKNGLLRGFLTAVVVFTSEDDN